jgi:hypothetical protein
MALGEIITFFVIISFLALVHNSFSFLDILAGSASNNIRHSSFKLGFGKSFQFEPIILNTLSIKPIIGIIPK